MARENSDLRKQINAPKAARSRKLNTEARFLTGKEGLRIRAEDAAKEAKEAEKAAEKAQRIHEAEESRQRQREGNASTIIWRGAWRNRSKADVRDLAFALELSMDGTKNELMKRIQAHLDKAPALAHDKRFEGLYIPVARGRRRLPQLPQQSPDPSENNSAEGVTDEDVYQNVPRPSDNLCPNVRQAQGDK